MNQQVADQVLAIYQQMDRQTTLFRSSTDLGCPPGCGRCCDNPRIEATPLEMLPMALALVQQHEAAGWLERLRSHSLPDICLFYQPDPAIPGNGSCQQYLWRPTVCRLFGYAAVMDKQGQPTLSACTQMQELVPEQVAAAQRAIAAGCPVPKFADFQAQIACIDPHWGNQYLPINQALHIALERASLALTYQDDSA